MNTEADTCLKHVVPKLVASEWDSDLHSIGAMLPAILVKAFKEEL
jgi:hypothetical protein